MHALTVALLLAASDAAPPPPLVIAGSVVRMREAPEESAPSLARLHLGTAVKLEEERGAWVKVAVVEHPGLAGWVLGRLVGGWTPVEDLRKRALLAEDTPDFVEAAERLVAAEGTEPKDLALLERAYLAKGRKADAAQVRARLEGKDAFYLAVCRGQRALLAARVTSDAVTALTDAAEAARPQLLKALAEVDSLPWWEAHRGGPLRLPGSPFARPQLAPVWNEGYEEMASPIDPKGAEVKLVLGKCERDGAVLATSPLALLPAGTLTRDASEAAQQRAGAALPVGPSVAADPVQVGVEVQRPFPDARFVAAAALYEARWAGHHEDWQGRAWVWGLLGRKGQTLPFGAQASLRRLTTLGDLWLGRALAPSSGLRLGVLTVEGTDEGDANGVHLILASPDGPRAGALCAFDRAGC